MPGTDSSRSAPSPHLSQPFDRDLLVFDVETTGINPHVHQIVSIGALLIDRITLQPKKEMSSLVRLSEEAFAAASPEAMKIHGLPFIALKNAPAPAEVVARFIDVFGADFYFCGWNICFDTQFLRALFEQAGRLEDFDRFSYHKLDLWSILELSWLRGLVPDPPHSLSIACSFFHIERPPVHDSMADARATALILTKSLPALLDGRKVKTMETSPVAAKPADAEAAAIFEGSMDWRKLLEGWRTVARNSADEHYDAQRRFNLRGRWIGGIATLLTAASGATAIKELASSPGETNWKIALAIVAAAAGVMTALHTFLGDETRAASHHSAAAGYATALRNIDEELTFGHTSAADAKKAADTIREALNALSSAAPEVPAGILRKRWTDPDHETPPNTNK